VEREHVDALDGLRGLAVIGVVLYHGGVSWLGGGFLGVELFFVLSGFLITSLLVGEWLRRGRIGLKRFWGRRARRLLPALIVLIVAIGVAYTAAGATKAVPGLFGDGLGALFYYANWHQIAAGGSYFAASGPVSPFQHTWSLAIEEQFYLVWPLVVLAVLWAVRSRGGPPVRTLQTLLTVALAGVIASAIDCALLSGGGASVDRLYYGTDTRATGLLAGAALAIGLALRRQRQAEAAAVRAAVSSPRRPRLPAPTLKWAAPAALALVLVGMRVATGSSPWLFPWGFLALDLAAVVLIAALVLAPGSPVDRVLSFAPLRGAGVISYGIYLWHFPLFLWLTTAATGLSGWRLLVLRVGATVTVSWLSYVLVEQPIRRRQVPNWSLRWLAPAGAGAAVASLIAAASATTLPVGVPVAATVPAARAAADLVGHDPACTVRLSDRAGLGLAGPPTAKATSQFEVNALGNHSLVWNGSSTKTFRTCPPRRVMVIGDSIAFTLGLPMLGDEQRYGVELANGSILGCAFSTRGELNVGGVWQKPDDGCADPLKTWAAEERSFHPSEVVVELGYRDEFEWRWGGKTVHLGQPAFDAYVQRQIDAYVKVLGRGGTRVLFLTVPFTSPPAQANGSPAVAGSPARHALINAMLARAAATDPRHAAVLDIDRTISPGRRYDGTVRGQLCRFDGVHFTMYCAKLLEPVVLSRARALLEH
jgi:peptidoglycan/LPS O-acetylase OafA/YrhL